MLRRAWSPPGRPGARRGTVRFVRAGCRTCYRRISGGPCCLWCASQPTCCLRMRAAVGCIIDEPPSEGRNALRVAEDRSGWAGGGWVGRRAGGMGTHMQGGVNERCHSTTSHTPRGTHSRETGLSTARQLTQRPRRREVSNFGSESESESESFHSHLDRVHKRAPGVPRLDEGATAPGRSSTRIATEVCPESFASA
jgi:hypothetical protein